MSDTQETWGGRRWNQGRLLGGGDTQPERRVMSRGSRGLRGRGRARGPIPRHCSSTRGTTALPPAGPTSLESNAEQIRQDCLKESQITRCPENPTTSPGHPRVSVSVESSRAVNGVGKRPGSPWLGRKWWVKIRARPLGSGQGPQKVIIL